MKKLKQFLLRFPEYYFLLLAILAGYTPPFHFNTVYLICAGVFITQAIFKNKISGLLLSVITSLINIFFLGALISEFREFTEFNNDAQELLYVGFLIFLVNIFASIMMFYKYAKSDAIFNIRPEPEL